MIQKIKHRTAVIETAAEEHKGFQMDWPGPYFNCNLLKSYKDFRLLKLQKIEGIASFEIEQIAQIVTRNMAARAAE